MTEKCKMRNLYKKAKTILIQLHPDKNKGHEEEVFPVFNLINLVFDEIKLSSKIIISRSNIEEKCRENSSIEDGWYICKKIEGFYKLNGTNQELITKFHKIIVKYLTSNEGESSDYRLLYQDSCK